MSRFQRKIYQRDVRPEVNFEEFIIPDDNVKSSSEETIFVIYGENHFVPFIGSKFRFRSNFVFDTETPFDNSISFFIEENEFSETLTDDQVSFSTNSTHFQDLVDVDSTINSIRVDYGFDIDTQTEVYPSVTNILGENLNAPYLKFTNISFSWPDENWSQETWDEFIRGESIFIWSHN